MRDLKADLEVCQRATPGPWCVEGTGGVHMDGTRDAYVIVESGGRRVCGPCKCLDDAHFVVTAREGWPEAIRRALEAEKRMRFLEHLLRNLGVMPNDHAALERHLDEMDALEAERDSLRARLADVEAQAAAMRSALEAWQAYWDHFAACGCHWQHTCDERARLRGVADRLTEAALSSNAGAVVLAEAAALRNACACALGQLRAWAVLDGCGDSRERETRDDAGYLRATINRLETALASDAGRETADRLRLLEELAEAAAAFAEYCTLVECLPRTEDAICDEDPCLKQRLKAAVKALEGGEADAGTGT